MNPPLPPEPPRQTYREAVQDLSKWALILTILILTSLAVGAILLKMKGG